jgi:low temperature requirement protein LtrA
MKLDSEQKTVAAVCLIIIAALLTAKFGATGLRAAIGLGIIYLIPAHYLLKRFEHDERILLAILSGVAVVPSITYFAGFISVRSGIVASVAVMVMAGLIINRMKTKENALPRESLPNHLKPSKQNPR